MWNWKSNGSQSWPSSLIPKNCLAYLGKMWCHGPYTLWEYICYVITPQKEYIQYDLLKVHLLYYLQYYLQRQTTWYQLLIQHLNVNHIITQILYHCLQLLLILQLLLKFFLTVELALVPTMVAKHSCFQIL